MIQLLNVRFLPFFYRLLLSDGALNRKLSNALVDAVLHGFGTSPRTPDVPTPA